MRTRSYRELIQLGTMQERFDYLGLFGEVGARTFGSDRFLNQVFYASKQWHEVRNEVIIRDASCDLAMPDYELAARVVIHHINPISIDDVKDENWDKLLNPDNLITTSYRTHQAIHYGNDRMLPIVPVERRPNDTKSW